MQPVGHSLQCLLHLVAVYATYVSQRVGHARTLRQSAGDVVGYVCTHLVVAHLGYGHIHASAILCQPLVAARQQPVGYGAPRLRSLATQVIAHPLHISLYVSAQIVARRRVVAQLCQHMALEHVLAQLVVAQSGYGYMAPGFIPFVISPVAHQWFYVYLLVHLHLGTTPAGVGVGSGNHAVEQPILRGAEIGGYAVAVVVVDIRHHLAVYAGNGGLGVAVVFAVAHQHHLLAYGPSQSLFELCATPSVMSETYEGAMDGCHICRVWLWVIFFVSDGLVIRGVLHRVVYRPAHHVVCVYIHRCAADLNDDVYAGDGCLLRVSCQIEYSRRDDV